MTLEEQYVAGVSLEHRKQFAQFFTPEPVAQFMCDWLLQGENIETVLEPAYGLGIFSRKLLVQKELDITGYELDTTIYEKALERQAPSVHLNNADYLLSSWEEKFEGIICNPPYFNFHDDDNSTYIPEVNSHLGIRLNGFTNIYTLFLLKSLAQLKEGGRCCYIVPSEFLNADYGVAVKQALLKSGMLRHVIVVDFEVCTFSDALTTSCIVLCENRGASSTVKFSTAKDIESLHAAMQSYREIPASQLDAKTKWRKFYTQQNTARYHNLVPFGTYAKVVRGIATGANQYFTFRRSKIAHYALDERHFIPCICHCADVKTSVFKTEDWQQLRDNDKNVFLFNGCSDSQNPAVSKYIHLGETQNIDKRYLTASRRPWYALEQRKPAPIWVSVFNRSGLRFVRNEANTYNLTTFHCVYPVKNNLFNNLNTDILFAYLLTDVAKEILLDNARQYGNGLVKFEPNDINNGQVVDFSLLTDEEKAYLMSLYQSIRNGEETDSQVQALDSFFRQKYTR